jgi:hypothetical protein
MAHLPLGRVDSVECGGRQSISFKVLCPVPVLLRASFRAAFLPPKNIGSLAKMLFVRLMPIFIRSPLMAAVPLP